MTGAGRLSTIRGFIVDLHGTTCVGDRLTFGARALFDAFLQTDRKFVFVTNDSSATAQSWAEWLRAREVPIDDRQVLTSGDVAATYLRRHGYRSAFVVGTPVLESLVRAGGVQTDAESPECVVLGLDRTLDYRKLERATRLIRNGAAFVATHPDLVCATEDGFVPDCGSLIGLLRAATGVSPQIVGKPEPLLMDSALARLGLPASDVAVIGDRLYTDIAMGRRAGSTTILVVGEETPRSTLATAAEHPDHVFDNLGAIAFALDIRALRPRAALPQQRREAV